MTSRGDDDIEFVPKDWEHPNFDEIRKQYKLVHEWKGYVSENVINMWHTFSHEQKKALAANFEDIAGREHWD